MADIHRLPSDDTLDREACAWIARLNAHNVSADEKAQFEAWRNAHPRHERAWIETAGVWRQMLDAGELARAVSTGQDFNALSERAVRRTLEVRKRGRRVAFAAAATVAVAVCGVWWAGTLTPDTLFQTAVGEHASVNLPDGSSLDLNSNSRARIVYSGQARIVRLERGEAYFNVKPDPRRPFWVTAGKSWIGAVGTAFNIDMRAEGVRVTVSEGAVKVATNATSPMPPGSQMGPGSIPVVRAGQQVDVHGTATAVRSLVPDQLTRSLSWREGSIYFKEDRLADVVDELNRYTQLRLVIGDDKLRDLVIGGTFETNAQGAEVLLANLTEGFGLKVRREGRAAYITER